MEGRDYLQIAQSFAANRAANATEKSVSQQREMITQQHAMASLLDELKDNIDDQKKHRETQSKLKNVLYKTKKSLAQIEEYGKQDGVAALLFSRFIKDSIPENIVEILEEIPDKEYADKLLDEIKLASDKYIEYSDELDNIIDLLNTRNMYKDSFDFINDSDKLNNTINISIDKVKEEYEDTFWDKLNKGSYKSKGELIKEDNDKINNARTMIRNLYNDLIGWKESQERKLLVTKMIEHPQVFELLGISTIDGEYHSDDFNIIIDKLENCIDAFSASHKTGKDEPMPIGNEEGNTGKIDDLSRL